MSVLAFQDATYRRDGITLIDGASFAVERDEIVAVIGPSGAGKTTLLRLAALFARPTAGTVRHDGVDPWTLDERGQLDARRSVGMVFQEASLFDTTVERNVRYGLAVRRTWSDRLARRCRDLLGVSNGRDRADELLGLVGLSGVHDVPVSTLSSGEAQRVAFARAVAVDPSIMLLDEPTSNLDPHNTAIIERAVRTACDGDTGVLLATHDMGQARRLADRTVVLIDGTVREVDATERIFEDPRDDRTAAFLAGELVY